MPISVVIGGQFGSEGKGKATLFFAKELGAKAVVRVGGPNSGHTVYNEDDRKFVFKNLPVSAILKNIYSVITAGNYINPEILLKEIEISGVNEEYLVIDPFAMIIGHQDLKKENKGKLMDSIGSTGSGTGAALLRRIKRSKTCLFAKDIPQLSKYIKPATPFLRYLLNSNERIIIEGTQGFGLSLLHSKVHPYTTSRDTSAAAFVSEAGLSPLDVDDIIMVIRSYPIRVGGKSGPLPNEINWEKVTELSGSEFPLIEYTSVTHKIRRVGFFDKNIVKDCIMVNSPTRIVLNHLDYIDRKSQNENGTSLKFVQFLAEIEQQLGCRIDYLGTNEKSLINRSEIEEKNIEVDHLIHH